MLTKDGVDSDSSRWTLQVSSRCPARKMLRGQETGSLCLPGAADITEGRVVCSDGSLQEDGNMGAACASSDRKLLARSVADGQATGRLRLAIIVSDSSLVEMTAINDHVQQPAPSLSPPGLPQGGGERYREDKDQGAGHLRLSTTVFWPGSAARRRAARLLDVLYCSLHLSSCLREGSRVRAGGRGEVDGLPGLQRSAGSLAQPAPHGQTTRTFHPCSRPRPVCPAGTSWTDQLAYRARPSPRVVDGLHGLQR